MAAAFARAPWELALHFYKRLLIDKGQHDADSALALARTELAKDLAGRLWAA